MRWAWFKHKILCMKMCPCGDFNVFEYKPGFWQCQRVGHRHSVHWVRPYNRRIAGWKIKGL